MALDETKNFAVVTVSTGYDASATSIVLSSGHGAKLPTPTVGYSLVWWNYTDYKNPSDDPNVEIVRCTSKSTDTLTVTRAQEGTSAATHNTSGKTYKMLLGITAKMISDIGSALDLKSPLASPTFTGTVTLPDVQLGETSIFLDDSLSADEKWSGIVITGTAGGTVAVGDLCYLKTADTKWYITDGITDGTDVAFKMQLGICVLAASASGSTKMLVYGKVRSASFPSFTIAAPVYMDNTDGDIVVAQPSTANYAIRIVGYALTADDLLFNPSNDYIVHT